MALQWSFKGVSIEFYGYFKEVQICFKEVSKVFPIKLLKGLKSVPRKF